MRILFTICLFIYSFFALAQEINLKGTYQGKNLYVQNPLSSDQSSYCTESVYLNGRVVLQSPKTSSFEINLSKLAINSPIEVRILYKNGCKPKVINPNVVKSNTSFKFVSFTIDDKNLHWTVEGESANSVYYVEHYINNNWTNVKVLTAQAGQSTYNIPVAHTVGSNSYRVKHQEKNGQIAYSQTVTYTSSQGMIKFYPRNVSNKIYFTGTVSYEISDAKKQLLKRGKGKEVDVSTLQRGVYYVSFDNRTEQFLKK